MLPSPICLKFTHPLPFHHNHQIERATIISSTFRQLLTPRDERTRARNFIFCLIHFLYFIYLYV